MPPKKAVAEGPKPLFGRPSSNVKIGIVGLPNVGKSTFFNILCSMQVEAQNFPFCTIDPNQSRVAVPDERFDHLVELFKPKSIVPAYLQVTDIAGLVKGAAEGQGLGNAFLSHIKACDAIYHCVRAFDDADIVHVEGDLDPIRDLKIISDELILKDIEHMEKQVVELEKIVARVDKLQKPAYELAQRVLQELKDGKEIRHGEWKAAEIEIINEWYLLTTKPVVYLVNMSENDFYRKKNKWLPKIKEFVDAKGAEPIIPFSVSFEQKISEIPPAEAEALCTANKVTSMMPKIIKTGYHALQLVHFFTAGADEVRAWTLRKNSKAPQGAGVIHTDFERGFICAEVYKFDDLKEHGSEMAVKNAGKYKQEGKQYVICDGDIIFFKFNVTAAPKKK